MLTGVFGTLGDPVVGSISMSLVVLSYEPNSVSSVRERHLTNRDFWLLWKYKLSMLSVE